MPPVVDAHVTTPAGAPFAVRPDRDLHGDVTDDTPVDCSRVSVAYVLGHDEHGHPLNSTAGCTGTITTFVDSGHAGAGNLRAVFIAVYTDAPDGPDVPPLTGDDEVVLTPASRGRPRARFHVEQTDA